jgi:uncharacterized BrkB/YihY/UPF0761 family membrane protein
VSTVLSLLAFVAYVALIIGFAAGITWVVVRLTPPQKKTGGPTGS